LLAIGIFDVQSRLHLIGSDLGLVLAHSVLCLPLTFLVMANALAFIDLSLEQAAWTWVRGGHMRSGLSVVPNLMPAIVGGLVISFVTSWDETVLALFQTGLDKTLPVTIYSFLKSGITTAVSAVAALVTVPVLLGAVILGVRAVLKARSTTMRTQT